MQERDFFGVDAAVKKEQPKRLYGSRRNERCVCAPLGTVSVVFAL